MAEEVALRHRDDVDRDARWPAETLRALADAGLMGLTLPRRYGGLGAGMAGLVAVCEELGEHCPSSALTFGMHCVASAVIAAKATADQAARYLGPIVQGRHVTTLALSEAGSGSHFYLPATSLQREGDGFVVDGRKHFVTNASYADSYVVSVAAQEEGPGSFSCLVVDRDAPGVAVGEGWRGLGMRGNDSRAVSLDNVRVP